MAPRHRMKLGLGLAGSAVFLAVATAAACSSSSSTPAAGTNEDSGTEASAPDDSGIRMIHELNDGADATAPPIMCGSMTCSAPSGAMLPLSPCCLPDNGCGAAFGAAVTAMFDAGGTDAGAVCLDTSPGTPDTACPSQTTMGFALAGCCAKSGVCGVDLSIAGLGCDSLSALAGLIPGGTGGDGGMGPPLACGAPADGGALDAGAGGSDGGAD
jgi:hypothetical protein